MHGVRKRRLKPWAAGMVAGAAALAALAGGPPAPAAAQGAAPASPAAVQPAAAGGTGAAPLAAQGCLGCHGPGGAGQPPIVGIAGRPAAETEALLKAFRANERPGTIMGRIARGYSDAEIAAAAAYFAAAPATR